MARDSIFYTVVDNQTGDEHRLDIEFDLQEEDP